MAHIEKLPLFVKCVIQNFPFIEEDFDALTNYELLCKVVEFLNKVITSQNEVIGVANNLQDAFQQLHDYVANYFDNLDVQEEINIKLDEMAEDGTLQEIITTYIQSNVAWTFDTVADMKLATNLVNGSYARTLGYYSINDGGGSLYKIKNTGVANEGDIIAIGSTLYAHLIGDYVKPEQCGAYGDGEHDDAPAIRLALGYIDKIGGGTVEFSSNKTYLIESVGNPDEARTTFFILPDNLTLCGEGCIKVADGFGDYDAIFSYNAALNSLIIKDFTIDANTTNNPISSSTGLSDGHRRNDFRFLGQATKNLIIDNLTFKDCTGVHQIIIERVINSEISNVKIDHASTGSPNYDRTSIYFGALNGTVHGCTLFGHNKGLTAIELHGKNNILCNNYVEGFTSGVFVTNENIVNEACGKLEVYSNTFKTTKRGIQTWMTNTVNIDTISIHDNHVVVSGNENYTLGIGNHDLVANGVTLNVCEIYNNVIEMSGTYAQAFRYAYTQSTNNSVIKHLNIHDNNVTGTYQYVLYIGSQADNKFEITKTDFNRNFMDITGATIAIYGTPRLGYQYLNVNENTLYSDTVYRFVRIFASTSTIVTKITNNISPITFNVNDIASGDAALTSNATVVHKGNIALNNSSSNNTLGTFHVGSVVENDYYRCKLTGTRWFIEYSGDHSPKHVYLTKGSVIHPSSDTAIMQIAKNNGYIADHDISTGEHVVGDWVKDGSTVYKVLINNNYTSAAASHTDYFASVGGVCTLYDITGA